MNDSGLQPAAVNELLGRFEDHVKYVQPLSTGLGADWKDAMLRRYTDIQVLLQGCYSNLLVVKIDATVKYKDLGVASSLEHHFIQMIDTS